MEEISWNTLPSVVLLEVFSYLSHADRITASSTCKYWRYTLYHANYWQNINFTIKANDEGSILRTRYLASCFATKLRNAKIKFDSLDPFCVQEVGRLLEKLPENIHLRSLVLEPSHCRMKCPRPERGSTENNYFERHLARPLRLIARQSRYIETLTLGCSERLTAHARPLLDILLAHQSCSLQCLGLASIKADPDSYELLDLEPSFFSAFLQLQVLSMDYDHVSDGVLAALVGVRRLVLHVHGVEDSHPGTTNAAWARLVRRRPSFELRLNLIHSYDSAELLHSDILKPAMPLTHLRAFFCFGMTVHTLRLLSSWYARHLRCLWLVDALDSAGAPPLVQPDNEPTDPLVMASWTCTNLEEIVLYGHRYSAENLIAIARLRGSALKRLEVLTDDVITAPDSLEDLQLEVSKALGRTWEASSLAALPACLSDPQGLGSDAFVLPAILADVES